MNLGNTPKERQLIFQGLINELIKELDELSKKEYSYSNFIGDDEWVEKKSVELKTELREAPS